MAITASQSQGRQWTHIDDLVGWRVFHIDTSHVHSTLVIIDDFCISCPARVAVHVTPSRLDEWLAADSHTQVMSVADRDTKYAGCYVAYSATIPRTHIYARGHAIHIDEKVVTSFTPATGAYTLEEKNAATMQMPVSTASPHKQPLPTGQSNQYSISSKPTASIHLHKPPPFPTGHSPADRKVLPTPEAALHGVNPLIADMGNDLTATTQPQPDEKRPNAEYESSKAQRHEQSEPEDQGTQNEAAERESERVEQAAPVPAPLNFSVLESDSESQQMSSSDSEDGEIISNADQVSNVEVISVDSVGQPKNAQENEIIYESEKDVNEVDDDYGPVELQSVDTAQREDTYEHSQTEMGTIDEPDKAVNEIDDDYGPVELQSTKGVDEVDDDYGPVELKIFPFLDC